MVASLSIGGWSWRRPLACPSTRARGRRLGVQACGRRETCAKRACTTRRRKTVVGGAVDERRASHRVPGAARRDRLDGLATAHGDARSPADREGRGGGGPAPGE